MKFVVVCSILLAVQTATARRFARDVTVIPLDFDGETAVSRNVPSMTPQLPVLENAPRYPSSRITNGQNATRGMFPYQVAIYIDNRAFCGGSLINESWVLTAAHCCYNSSSFTMYFGANQLNANENGRVVLTSTQKTIHENYTTSNLNNDVCVIKLPSKVNTTTYIQIIKLVSRAMASNSFTNQTVRVSGWGKTSDNATTITQTLQYVDVSVISNSQCQQTYGTSIIQSSNMCTSVVLSRGTCSGDSGGPLVVLGNPPYQVGVVSFVSSRGCTSGDPDGFARCGSYLDWIQKNTGVTMS